MTNPAINGASWALHGAEGWYVRGTPEHYRCFRVYIPALQSIPISDTLAFFPKKAFQTPFVSPADELKLAAKELLHVLQQPPRPETPLFEIGQPEQNALKELSTIFNESLPVSHKQLPGVPNKQQE